jgi:hypothetical protein
MPSTYAEAHRLADRLETLCEPYRQNAISWLALCTQTPMDNPRADMLRFLSVLNPIVRETFVLHAGKVLDEAVRYFGVRHGDTSPLRPLQPAGAQQPMVVQSA